MSPTGNGNSKKIYRKTAKDPTTTIDLDFETQRVFNTIDGRMDISTVAEQAGVSIVVLWQAIAKLTRLGLIETGVVVIDSMGKNFADKLHRELTKAVGPMSNVLIKNVLGIAKITWPHIPPDQAREIIYRLVVQIPNDKLKNNFQETMLKEL